MQDSQPGPSARPAGDGTRPVLARGHRGSTDVIHENLRIDILSGVIAPGSELSQTQVAKDFGVSRGPVREAFRLLQREGLIEAEVNHRATVTDLSVQEVEHVYALRVANEALALSISVPRFTTADLDELDRLVIAVGEVQGRDFATWEEQHQKFHALLLGYAGHRMRHSLSQWAEYTARYRRVYVGDATGGWTLGAPEHAQMAQACRARDEATAVSLLARHLSRAALTLIAMMDPTHDPTLLRAAVRQVTASVEVSYGEAPFDRPRASGARRRRTTSSRSA